VTEMTGAEHVPERLALMRTVADRIRRFLEGGAASAVLDESARREATKLHSIVEPSTTERVDVDVHALVGYWYWCRHHAAQGRPDQTDLAISLAVYSVLLQVQPDAVPQPVLQHVDERLGHYRGSSPSAGRGGEIHDLALKMLDLHRTSRAPEPLETGIDMLRLALDATAPGDVAARAIALSNLGSALVRRSERTGDADDLKEAFAASMAAVEETAIAAHLCVGNLANLATAKRGLFEHTGEPADAEAAVAASQAAVALTPTGDPELPGRLSNLAAALQQRFELQRDRADVKGAVAAGRASLALVDPADPERSGSMTNLAVSLQSQFRLDGDPAILNEAIDLFRDAAVQTADRRAACLTNLSNALHTRYELRRDPADLEAAISASRAAADADQ
jgi:hypothetical protein